LKLLTVNEKFNTVILVPLYVFAISVLGAFLFSLFDLFNSSNILFGFGIVTINISWIYMTRNIKEEDKNERKKKDRVAFGILVYSGYCFLASFCFGFLVV
jgi:hypothetical protein